MKTRQAAPLASFLLALGCTSVAPDTPPMPVPGSCRDPYSAPTAIRTQSPRTVKAIAYVDFDGTVMATGILASSGYADVDEAAQIAIASCRWTPATHAGHATWGEATMTFDSKSPR